MAEIQSFKPDSELQKETFTQRFRNKINSLDTFTKSFLIIALLFIAITPILIATNLLFSPNAYDGGRFRHHHGGGGGGNPPTPTPQLIPTATPIIIPTPTGGVILNGKPSLMVSGKVANGVVLPLLKSGDQVFAFSMRDLSGTPITASSTKFQQAVALLESISSSTGLVKNLVLSSIDDLNSVKG